MYMYKGQVDSRYNDDDRSSRIYIYLSLSHTFSLLLLLTFAQHKH